MALSARPIPILVAVLVALLGLAALGTWQLTRIRAWNALIASDRAAFASADLPEEVRFARALALSERGDFLAALAGYRDLASIAHGPVRAAATFNEGNLLLREGLALRVAGDEFRAMPLLELAKETYRELLRQSPSHWDARYNLELALRAAPEPEGEQTVSSLPPVPVRRSEIILRRPTLGLP